MAYVIYIFLFISEYFTNLNMLFTLEPVHKYGIFTVQYAIKNKNVFCSILVQNDKNKTAILCYVSVCHFR